MAALILTATYVRRCHWYCKTAGRPDDQTLVHSTCPHVGVGSTGNGKDVPGEGYQTVVWCISGSELKLCGIILQRCPWGEYQTVVWCISGSELKLCGIILQRCPSGEYQTAVWYISSSELKLCGIILQRCP